MEGAVCGLSGTVMYAPGLRMEAFPSTQLPGAFTCLREDRDAALPVHGIVCAMHIPVGRALLAPAGTAVRGRCSTSFAA